MTYLLATLSDVHADLQALEDALRHIDALGCDAIVCAGDIVNYGRFPDDTIQLLVTRGIPTIRGNHDRWAVDTKSGWGFDARHAFLAGSGTRAPLSSASMRWLEELPTKWEARIEGVRVAVHHGRPPKSDMDPVLPAELTLSEGRRLLDAADADVLVVGHSHIAFALEVVGRGWIVNPGATLRDPAPGVASPPATATFGVLTVPSLEFSVRSVTDGEEGTLLRRSIVW